MPPKAQRPAPESINIIRNLARRVRRHNSITSVDITVVVLIQKAFRSRIWSQRSNRPMFAAAGILGREAVMVPRFTNPARALVVGVRAIVETAGGAITARESDGGGEREESEEYGSVHIGVVRSSRFDDFV
jgi:hypothetical protein